MSQRGVEVIVGRLVTDEGFRARFGRDPRATLEAAARKEVDLTPAEIEALANMPGRAWEAMAELVDPRLQRVSLPLPEEVTSGLPGSPCCDRGEGEP
jgi:hypothetical protein